LAYFCGHWAQFHWPSSWKKLPILRNMSLSELIPVVLALYSSSANGIGQALFNPKPDLNWSKKKNPSLIYLQCIWCYWIILSSLTTVCKSSYEVNLFKAAFSLAFHELFRVGELTVSNGMCRHVLLLLNLSILNNHLKIVICSSKTDQYGKGTTMLIPSQIDQSICPLKLVNEYIKVRPLIQGQRTPIVVTKQWTLYKGSYFYILIN
jgi:hypothetical protein